MNLIDEFSSNSKVGDNKFMQFQVHTDEMIHANEQFLLNETLRVTIKTH